jgi:hypothetical protein
MTLRPSLAALLICTILPGCGGSDTDDRAPAPLRLSDAEQVASTVRRQMQAVARGDGVTACGLFSPKALQEAQDQVSRRGADIGCVTAIEQGAGGLPRDVLRALRRPAITRVEVQGDRAKVHVRLPVQLTALARGAGLAGGGTPLRRIDGAWRVDGLQF